ncbi:1-acyl-sn-glycerol-3-phosphate acyltransferase [Palleronia caenipelagi]|uniref:1-acyl-sn-glycerol-3-phosphate acyltransferase n=2 Tax=Palleronia caenipelagi TaxID=2489174 RepID=A0A547Q6D5_9RHOB|nr:1-acyl-sn-glycerol-3-phosphate acyltransferase [Palleronia caenipelagi]
MLAVHMLVRLIERPICGHHRPVTPWITVTVCRGALRIIGLKHQVSGPQMQGEGAMVANHVSWLDIFVLNSVEPLYFVSKAEVAGWPGIGLLAKATGTLFIRRDRREAKRQQAELEERLHARHRLLFFPEGTSTDGIRVLPFKTTLFAAFMTDELRDEMQVQPISVLYHPPDGGDSRFYGWWGEMEFGENLIKILSAPRHGRVEVRRHDPIAVATHPNRKALARLAEETVRGGLRRAGLLAGSDDEG